ncbi:DPY30 domain-containing protein 1-like [Rhopilema esculentum]|uniref:DPY30 domain-containing protein 1-like n=1 Tax=Rhopilema esculentum TaxID=499914 RepID=UPI0031DB7577
MTTIHSAILIIFVFCCVSCFVVEKIQMDSEYLKKHVGDALSRGLVEISQKRPSDPIEYLASWLRKYVDNREYTKKKSEELAQLEKEREEYEKELQRQKAMEEEQRLIAEQEALEKAAAEPPPVEEEAKDTPNIETENLPTVAEGDEEEKKPEDGEVAKESISTETVGEQQQPEEPAKEPEPATAEKEDDS